ncbi:MAG: secretin N-terminal domain-containing protein [Gemmatimonadaceae bacterium]|nr:secretin N-terminal domain-containing protein [Gemmatimonadaceae bacterium]
MALLLTLPPRCVARRGLLALTVLCVAPSVRPLDAQAAPPAATRSGTTTLRFLDARLDDVIASLGQLMGLAIITSDIPDKRVSLQTPGPVPLSSLGGVLETLLESNGLVLVRSGSVAQVVPAAQAPATAEVGVGYDLPDPPPLGLVARLVPLKFLRPDEAIAALRPVASQTARLEAVARQNAILVSDRGANVARYLQLLQRVDVPAQGENGLRTYVISLKYAVAEDLAATLGQLYGVNVSGGRRGSLDDRALSRSLENFRSRESETFRTRQSPTTAGAPAATTGGDSTRGPGALVGQTTIVASPPGNALVIRTAPPNIALLRETIDSLDRRPAQVLLEVTVAEVNLGRGLEYGIDWAAASANARTQGGVQFGTPIAPDSFTVIDDVLAKVTRLGSVDVRAVLRAISSTSQVKVLSTPEVFAVNNREARILVGSRFPFIASTRLGNDVSIDRAVQYEQVGTQLTIVPTINDDGYVSVQLLQEVSTLTQQTVAAALNAPVIATREAATRAIVRDGQTAVIGGLIGTTDEVIESGVPLLREIPLLGWLFKRKETNRQRTELAIFITPYIVRTDAEADALLQRARQRTEQPEGGDARNTPRPARPPSR